MLRLPLLPLVLLCSALLAEPVTAAAWRELPAYELPGGRGAICLRSDGPGAVTIGSSDRRLQRLAIAGDAVTASPLAALGASTLCPEPSVAGPARLLAGPVAAGGGRQRMAVRSGGGAPTLLGGAAARHVGQPAVAVAPSGAAIVAWVEHPAGFRAPGTIVAAVRPSATAPFGATQRLGASDLVSGPPRAGIDDSGRAHVTWSDMTRTGSSSVRLASAAAGRPFATPRTLVSGRGMEEGTPQLAVAADGRALLATPQSAGVAIWELAPGATGFARGQLLSIPSDELALSLRADGAAVLAGRSPIDVDVALVRRAGPGRFARPVALRTPDVGRRWSGSYAQILSVVASDGRRLVDARQPQLGVALADDGELVVSWFDAARDRLPSIPYAWRGTLSSLPRGRDPESGITIAGRGTRLGSPCRATGAITPVTLADGRLAVAWSDDGRSQGDWLGEYGTGDGRVHVAVPGATPETTTATAAQPAAGDRAGAAAPRVRAQLVSGRRVGSGGAVRLRLRCDGGPCDVRALATAEPYGGSGGMVAESGSSVSAATTIPSAGGSATVTLRPQRAYAFAQPRRTARPPIELTVCTPAGAVAQRLTVRPHLRGRPLPPAPAIVGLRARRLAGGRFRVSWRLSRPVRDDEAFLTASLTGAHDWPLDDALVRPRGRTSFAVTLDPDRIPEEEPARPQRITVALATSVTFDAAHASVPVR